MKWLTGIGGEQDFVLTQKLKSGNCGLCTLPNTSRNLYFCIGREGNETQTHTWFLLSREGNERKSILVSWYGQESTRE